MQFLRTTKPLARFVLLWFVLSLGVAIASPWVNPKPLQLVCSVAGVAKLVAVSDDGAPAQLAHALDCPLCMGSGAPPPPVQGVTAPLRATADGKPLFGSHHRPRHAAAPFPARGPPTSV